MTDSNDYNDTNALCIGTQETGGGNTINGFISNVRIVKGTQHSILVISPHQQKTGECN